MACWQSKDIIKQTKTALPVGLIDKVDIGQGVGQGTLEGAIVSAVSLDSGVDDFFADSEYAVSQSSTRMTWLGF